MKILLVLFFSLVGLCHSLQAAETKVSKVELRDSIGETFKVALSEYVNHNETLEVRIEAAGIPRFASKINPVLGFGRDIDGNGKIESWFLVTKSGIDYVKKEGQDRLGKDVLSDILQKKYRSKFSMYVTSATSSIFSYLLLSMNAGVSIQEEFYRDWMDLEESRILFEADYEELGSAYTYNQQQFHRELLSFGYKELANKMDKFGKQTFWGYAFADIGLWITGGVVINWAGKILAKIGVIASETAFVTAVKETFIGFFEKQKTLIENRVSVLKDKFSGAKVNAGMKVAEKQVTAALTVATWKTVLSHTIKSYKIKGKLRLYVKKSIRWPKKIMIGAKSEWKYISLNAGVQLGSEAMARYDEIHNDNPAIMAQNLLTNPDVIQNVGFMTADTILMTGISKNLKTTKARFMASGAVAVTNSSIVNFALKDEADMNRVLLDTGWETIIGNAQIQLDLKALEYFEKMALKKNNPKIKLVGYVIALVDMGVGYVAYSKATSYVESKAAEKEAKESKESSEPKVMLVPVLAEN